MRKNIKLFLSLLIVLLLSGCTVEYNLSFVNKQLNEEINVSLSGPDYQVNNVESLKNYKLLAISQGLDQIAYNSSYKDTGSEFIANYKYTYSINNFNKNNIIRQCYDSFSLTQDDDYYLLVTNNTFKCLAVTDYTFVDSYKIRITTNHKVVEHNADEVKGDTYIWNITNSNNDVDVTKPINIKFSKELIQESPFKQLSKVIIPLLIILLIGGILLFIVNKSKNKDK